MDDTKTTTTPGIESQQNHHPNLSFPSVTLQTLPHVTDYFPDLPTHTNPLDHNPFYHHFDGFYISLSEVVLRQILCDFSSIFPISGHHQAYHRAGPRKKIFFDPAQVHAVIVTCGGLCPGMITVIRQLVVGQWELYGVHHISGVLSGYRGFYSSELVQLNPKLVHNWHRQGGTVLQASRGGFDLGKIVDAIEARGFNQVI
ncbi:hypothetical protein AAC387_Pa02g1752 [Persea americana]